MKILPLPFLVSFALCTSMSAIAADSTETAAKTAASESTRKPTIFVCGDSTSKSSGKGKSGEQIAGWGTPIADYFDPAKVTINNVGHAGQSSRTYYDRDWPNVLPKINAGDYVLLVFGINDGTTLPGIGEETREGKGGTEHSYGWYMSKMATDATEKGAHVYLLTVTTRNIWTNPKAKFRDATPTEALPADYDAKDDRIERGTGNGRFTKWTKEIGEKLHVPVFDLTNYCADKYETMGRETVDKLYSDHNHTYMPGADMVATSIVSGLKAFKDSPFTALLSEKGRGLATADAKFVSDNLPAAVAQQTKRGTADDSLKNATLVYVGTYTNTPAKSQGIYVFKLLGSETQEVSQNVTLAPLGLAAEAANPSYLVLDARRTLLFAVNETSNFGGKPAGAVSSFSMDRETGNLKLINQQSSLGTDPCHLTLDQTGKFLLVANYSSGSVAVFPVDETGKLGESSDFVQHTGSSVKKNRQSGPHAHCVTMSTADNKFAFVCDLGLDKVLVYKFDAEKGKLTPHDPAFVSLKPGAGPRHFAFRPDGKFAYVINELDSTVTAFAYDPSNGTLSEIQTISTLPGHYDGPNSCAELTVHPSGKYLYASNRGHNSVTLFEINSADGKLSFIEDQHTGGKTPRHFGMESTAKHLTFANQDSNTLLVCRIDAPNGRLKPSGVFVDCPAPVCVQFVSPANKTAEATKPTSN